MKQLKIFHALDDCDEEEFTSEGVDLYEKLSKMRPIADFSMKAVNSFEKLKCLRINEPFRQKVW
jgi:hypothetical protein